MSDDGIYFIRREYDGTIAFGKRHPSGSAVRIQIQKDLTGVQEFDLPMLTAAKERLDGIYSSWAASREYHLSPKKGGILDFTKDPKRPFYRKVNNEDA